MFHRPSRWLPLVLGLGVTAAFVACSGAPDDAPVAKFKQAISTTLVLSQVYGGGGSGTAGTLYKYDHVEIKNIGTSDVSLNGLSVQYTSATGPSTGWQVLALPNVTLAAGKHFLVQIGSAGTAGADLPTADVSTTAFSMSATAGKVALVSGTTALTCGTAAARCATTAWIDMVGYGSTASDYEGAAIGGTISGATTLLRKNAGCTDTDNNQNDFDVASSSTPHNNSAPAAGCGSDAGTDASDADATDAEDAADAADSGAADSGAADSGAADSGAADAADSGAADSGAADSGAADSGAADSGAADSGAADSGAADSATTDSGAADSATTDSATTDSGAADAPDADTGAAEDTGTAPTDTGTAPADTGSTPADTGADTGSVAPAETETDSGCGCATPGTSSTRTTQGLAAAALLAGLVATRRRRR